MFHKILCPIDFAPASQHALRLAARIAADHDAELTVVHVWYIPPLTAGEFPIPADALKTMIDDEQRGLDEAVAQAVALGAKRVSSRVLTGVPWDRIVDAVRQDRAFDLVVVGTHGRTGIARWMLGSVAEKVVRHAPCSVLVARGRGEAASLRHALCPLDFSEHSRFALEQAAQLVVAGGEGLSLVHVIEPPRVHQTTPPLSDLVNDLDRRATLQLEQWASETKRAEGVAIASDIRVGDPASEVLSMIEDDDTIDLVAVGTHGRTGIQRVLIGSVAEKIVRHAPCPVLVARRRG